MSDNRDFKGVWIPKEIWLNEDLTLLEKAIYVEVDSLDNENHCTASNEYFANFCNCSESKVSKAIKKLQELGMIEVISFDGRHRKMRVAKNAMQGSKKCYADCQKVLTNNIDNNTNSNIDKKENMKVNKDILGKTAKSQSDKEKAIEYVYRMYENICVDLPRVRVLSESRKKAIAKLLKNYTVMDIEKCFLKANASDYLLGRVNGWKADFDWLLKEEKFVRVLEGRYDNFSNKSQMKNKAWEKSVKSSAYTEKEEKDIEHWQSEMRKKGVRVDF